MGVGVRSIRRQRWADSGPTPVASRTTGIRAIAAIELRARNSDDPLRRHSSGRVAGSCRGPLIVVDRRNSHCGLRSWTSGLRNILLVRRQLHSMLPDIDLLSELLSRYSRWRSPPLNSRQRNQCDGDSEQADHNHPFNRSVMLVRIPPRHELNPVRKNWSD
jgi:hypothetical protein